VPKAYLLLSDQTILQDKYPNFKYIDILNSQIKSFQLKFTERLENRLSSKTIKVLLSNRKLTGRKRIAFDSNVHKIAISPDELENVKQLNCILQKFESDNTYLKVCFQVSL
jgi:hypothetical protein